MSNYHVAGCRMAMLGHTDAAKRVADTFNLHRVANPYNSVGKWFAARLADGTTDNVLYDTKPDCIVHQHHSEQFYTFIRISPITMSVCDAEIMLSVARRAYDAGFRLTDPDDSQGGKELIKRLTREDQYAASKGVATNLVMPWEE